MKAQGFFGNPTPRNKATKVRQVGTTGTVTNKTGSIPRKTKVKQVGTHSGTGNSDNSKMFRDPTLSTKSNIGRPIGKVRATNNSKGI